MAPKEVEEELLVCAVRTALTFMVLHLGLSLVFLISLNAFICPCHLVSPVRYLSLGLLLLLLFFLHA